MSVRIVIEKRSLSDGALLDAQTIPVNHAGTLPQKQAYARGLIRRDYPEHQRTLLGSYTKKFPEAGYLEEINVQVVG